MMNFKILILMILALAFASAASAHVYDADMYVSPSNSIAAGQSFSMQGYIHSDERLYADDIKIDVYDYSGDLYTTFEPSFVTNSHDSYDYMGSFYSTAALYTTGNYVLKLKVDDRTEVTKEVYIYGNSNNNGNYGGLGVTNISLSTDVFYPGDIVDAYITVVNGNPNEVQYKFTYIVDNEVFQSGDVFYIQGNSKAVLTVPVEIPDADQFKLTAKASDSFNAVSNSKIFLISDKMKYFSLVADKSESIIDAGYSTVLKLTIKNRGNENDVYTIDVDGWTYYTANSTVAISAAKNKTVSMTFNVPQETRVGTYPIVIQVCNTNEICRTKSFDIVVTKPESAQSWIVWNENLTTVKFKNNGTALVYKFNITNDGIKDKSYGISIDASEGLKSELSEKEFTLAPDEQKTVVLKLTPAEQKNYTADISMVSGGTVIFDKELTVEYSEHPEGDSGLTGMFITGVEGAYMPGLMALAFIGIIFIVITFYGKLRRKTWTEKVIGYQKPNVYAGQKPNVYAGYTAEHPRSGMAGMYGPQTVMPQQPTYQERPDSGIEQI